jgi:hypothetical protein
VSKYKLRREEEDPLNQASLCLPAALIGPLFDYEDMIAKVLPKRRDVLNRHPLGKVWQIDLPREIIEDQVALHVERRGPLMFGISPDLDPLCFQVTLRCEGR